MRTITPQLSALAPAGWVSAEQLTLISPGGFPNVMVSSAPLPIDTVLPSIEEQGEALRRDLPGYVERSLEQVRFLGGPGTLRHYEWVARTGIPVTQLQLYGVAGGREHTATVTAVTADFPAQEAVLRGMLASVARGERASHAGVRQRRIRPVDRKGAGLRRRGARQR